MDGNVDNAFALVEENRWYLYGHLSDIVAISHVVCLWEHTQDPRRDSIKVGKVRRVWGEKIPDDDSIAEVEDVPGATFSIVTSDTPVRGMFPVTVVHDLEWLTKIEKMLKQSGWPCRIPPMENVLGATILSINGCEEGSDKVEIVTDRGSLFMGASKYQTEEYTTMEVADVVGDIADVIGRVVRIAEERTDEDCPSGYEHSGGETWTFYEIRTDGGDITIRWCCGNDWYTTITPTMTWEPTNA